MKANCAIRDLQAALSWSLVVLILLVVPLPVGAAQQKQGTVHVVQRGEHLTAIAKRYGTTPQAIASTNNLVNLNLLYVGQRLVVPGAGTPGTSSYYTVRAGDTASAIAARFGVTLPALVQANALISADRIFIGQRLLIPGGSSTPSAPATTSTHYVVQRGDTVTSIAVRHGVTAWAIVQANQLANANFIYAGQRLVVPGGAAPAPAPDPAPPQPSASNKRILIDLSDQRMYVYQDGQLLYNWVVSTGMPGAATIPGQFSVLTKIPNAYAYTWGLQMPYWLGIYWAGSLQNGIHALPILPNGQLLWEGYLGKPVSYGCVILSTANAVTLYNWAEVGTPVDIQW